GVRRRHQPDRMAGTARRPAARAAPRHPPRLRGRGPHRRAGCRRRLAGASRRPVRMSADRAVALTAFLERAGWGAPPRAPLPGDASFRRYVRLHRSGETAMLMDAPPPQEDVRPFVDIARLLHGLGYSAPAILAEDTTQGFLLIEDFGDRTYTRALAAGA